MFVDRIREIVSFELGIEIGKDVFSWPIPLYNPYFYLWKSLKKYLGTIVFLSWMPYFN